MIRRALLAAIFSSLLYACCPLTSVNPVGNPQHAVYDQRLTGAWRGEGEDIYLHIGQGEGGRIRVLAVEHGSGSKFDHALFNVFATRINNQDYLNIDLAELSRDITLDYTGYIIVRYHLSDPDTLTFTPMTLDAVAEAIQTKTLAGELIYTDESHQASPSAQPTPSKADCARITDTCEHIRAYLSDDVRAKKLFANAITLKRVK